MAKIAVDIDSTLYDFATECREAFFEMAIEQGDKSLLRGAYAPITEWRSFADVLGFEKLLEAIDRVHAPENILQQPPYKHSVRVLNSLYNENHEIKYVTTRSNESHNATDEWLALCSFPPGELHIAGDTKSEYLKDCKYLIDDRPKTLLDFVYDYDWKHKRSFEFDNIPGWQDSGERLAFGLWFPYNQALTDVKNILLAPTWRGIEYYLKRKGVLDAAKDYRIPAF